MFAHTPAAAGGPWHALDEHLRAVAEMAAEFARPFGGEDLARLAGLLHDAGKASPEFQAYLQACAREPGEKHRTVDHKGAGTLRSIDLCEPLGFLIHGHHGGLPDRGTLGTRLKELMGRRSEFRPTLERFEGLEIDVPSSPPGIPPWATATRTGFEFFLRMLFSALVDGDHSDTERHFNPEDAERRAGMPGIADLWERFALSAAEIDALVDRQGNAASPVTLVRRAVYDGCLAKAAEAPGFFRLTVPTGGGKTRSGLGFALRHALAHDLRRVIVAVPYLTITDQTSDVFRQIFGDDRAVLEHYGSAGDRDGAGSTDEQGGQSPRETWRRLAAQNWDAPVIVTTTVQLFESLFGRKTTSCRKLHRIARSVIILDEAQTLPTHLRGPIFDALQELVAHFSVSVVLCTATQPALDTLDDILPPTAVREIAPDPPRLFRMLERVTYRWPEADERWSWSETADAMRASPQALAIVNTIGDSRALLDALDDLAALHLSTMMCGAHRRDVLAIVRARLERGDPCRLVSTQVVEAGVDIDFPLVLRAMGPLDRIVQAAGRCNREGRLERGEMIVFEPDEGTTPGGAYRAGTGETRVMLKAGAIDVHDPETFLGYFRRLHSLLPADRDGIQPLRAELRYEDVAERFRMIADDTASLFVHYKGLSEGRTGEGGAPQEKWAKLQHALHRAADGADPGSARALLMQAQPYLVSVRKRRLEEYVRQGTAVELIAGVWEWIGGYDAVRGLTDETMDPSALYV